jgi:glycolate oxidase
MPEMFSEGDLKQQERVKCAFDPELLLNPVGFPGAASLRGTGADARRPRRAAASELPRF